MLHGSGLTPVRDPAAPAGACRYSVTRQKRGAKGSGSGRSSCTGSTCTSPCVSLAVSPRLFPLQKHRTHDYVERVSWRTLLGCRRSGLKRLASALVVIAVAPAVGSASVTDQLNAALNGPGVLFRTPDFIEGEKVPGTYLSNQIDPPTSVYQTPGYNGPNKDGSWGPVDFGQPSPWCGGEPDEYKVTDVWGDSYRVGRNYSTLFDGYFVQPYKDTTGDCNYDAYQYAIVGKAAIGDIKSIAGTFYPTDANALDARFASYADSQKNPPTKAADGRGCHYNGSDKGGWAPNQTDARNYNGVALVKTEQCACMDPAALSPQAWVSQWIHYAGDAEGDGGANPNSKATWLVLSSLTNNNPPFWFNKKGGQNTGYQERTVKDGAYLQYVHWYDVVGDAGRNNKAPMWGLDLASCWYEDPGPMVALQNELWERRGEWWNGYAPRPPTGHEQLTDLIGMKYYWGWNEVVLDKAKFDAATVANVIKLPAGQARIAELSPAAQQQLGRDLAASPRDLPVVVMSESLVLGTENNPRFRRSFSCQPYDFGSIAISCPSPPPPSSSTGVIVPSDPAKKTEPCSQTFFQMEGRTATFDSSRKAWKLVSRIKIMEDAEEACRTDLTFIYTNVQRNKRFKQLPGSTLGYRTLKGKNFSAPVISWPTTKEMKYQSGGKKNARLVLVSYVVKPAPKDIRVDIVRVIPTNPAAPVSESNRKGAQQSVLTTKTGWAQVISRPTP